MNSRLQQFISAENITQAEFADSIGVTRASISHILSGRNKPGYDFISNVMKRYPSLNIEWLLNGQGKMYKSGDAPSIWNEVRTELNEAGKADDMEVKEQEPSGTVTPENGHNQGSSETDGHTSIITGNEPAQPRKALKTVIFYDDGTYQELRG